MSGILRTPESITEEIRAVSDIVAVIGQYIALKPCGRDFRGLCPFHREKTPSFHVRSAEQYFKCFGCSKAGDVFTFLMELHSINFTEARQMLGDRAGISLASNATRSGDSAVSRQDILRVNEWAAGHFRRLLLSPQGGPAREYLAKRRISDQMSESFNLGFAPNSYDILCSQAGKVGITERMLLAAGLVRSGENAACFDYFRNRLMFPIVDQADRVLGFGGRALGDEPAKYINSPETSVFRKGQCLYGLNLARRQFDKRGRAVLVEGYTDVIMAHQHGFSETVAPLGTAFTEQQSDLLRRYVSRVVVAFDADQAGRRAADRGLQIALKSHLDVFLAAMPEGMDPCDFLLRRSEAEFEELLISAPSALSFRWQSTLREHRNGDSPAARLQAVRSFIDFIATSDVLGGLDAMQRGLAIDQLARLLNIRREEICQQIQVARKRATARRGTQTSDEVDEQSPQPRPKDGREAAARDILIALICEPGLYPRASELFASELFLDPQLRRIAKGTLELIRDFGEFSVSELIEKTASPADAACIVSLLEQGRSAGKVADRLTAAIDRLKAVAAARRSSEVQQEWYAAQSADPGSEERDQDRSLAELFDRTKEYTNTSNFAGIRKMNRDTVRQ